MTERTKKFKILYWCFTIVSILCNVAPLAVYIIKALVEANLTHEKIALSMTVFVVLIMTIISYANKIVLRSRIWIILIGIYICLDYIMTPLIVIAVCQILDELIVSPLSHKFKLDYKINKEMDKRHEN